MRPLGIELDSPVSPAAVVAGLDEADHPAVLWGDGWFGGGVLIGIRPQRFYAGVDSAVAVDLLGDRSATTDAILSGDVIVCPVM